MIRNPIKKNKSLKDYTDIVNFVDSDISKLQDFVELQLSLPSLVYKNMVSDDSTVNAFVTDKHETISYPLWTNNEYRLTEIYSSSLSASKNYYASIYSDSSLLSSSLEFDISYGDINSVGSSQRTVYGNITNMRETKTIYSQFNTTLNPIHSGSFIFNYPSWQKSMVTASRILSSGTNVSGSLGHSNLLDSSRHKSVMPLDNFDVVCAGYYYSSALKSDGTILTWGDNTYGQLGDGTNIHREYPVVVSDIGEWKFLASGPTHTLAIKKDGTLWAWGKNDLGQLGDGTIINSNIPILIDSGEWIFASAGNGFSLAIKKDGTLWSWGDNTRGQLGNGFSGVSSITPAQVGTSEDWRKIYANCHTGSDGFAVGILADGSLWGFGSNDTYQLGLNDNIDRYTPTQISSDSWNMISAGSNHCIGIKSNSQLFIWGLNSDYQLGNATNITITQPTKNIINGDNWVHVNTSIKSSIGIKKNGRCYVWGSNLYGELGLQGVTSTTPIVPFSTANMSEDLLYSSTQKTACISNHYDQSSINGGHSLVVHQYSLPIDAYTKSDYVYIINVKRDRYKDEIEPGHWQLSLCAVDSENKIIEEIEPITLIDDSLLTNIDIDKRPYYNIYRGSLTDGFYTGSLSAPFGLFSPSTGTIILNGSALYSFQSLLKDKNKSGINTIFNSINGAMSFGDGYGFIGRSLERSENLHAFIRIHGDDFNYTNNPTYTYGDNKNIRPEFIVNNDGTTYITSIGLYNDDQDLLAVAKLSRPIKKNKETELVIKIRIKF